MQACMTKIFSEPQPSCKGHLPKSTKDDSRFCASCDVYESNMKDKGVFKSLVKYTVIICHRTTIQPDGN